MMPRMSSWARVSSSSKGLTCSLPYWARANSSSCLTAPWSYLPEQVLHRHGVRSSSNETSGTLDVEYAGVLPGSFLERRCFHNVVPSARAPATPMAPPPMATAGLLAPLEH